MKTRTSGGIGLLAALCLVTSCDGGATFYDPAPSATPDGTAARPFTATWLQQQIRGDRDLGSPVTNATCRTNQVDPDGIGTYACNVTFSDGGADTDAIISVFPDGSWQQN